MALAAGSFIYKESPETVKHVPGQSMDAKSQHRVTPEPRLEDEVLLRGAGRYAADVPWPNQAYAHFVRSPHAFARIASVDVTAARDAPGVVGVLTSRDIEGLGGITASRRFTGAAARR